MPRTADTSPSARLPAVHQTVDAQRIASVQILQRGPAKKGAPARLIPVMKSNIWHRQVWPARTAGSSRALFSSWIREVIMTMLDNAFGIGRQNREWLPIPQSHPFHRL